MRQWNGFSPYNRRNGRPAAKPAFSDPALSHMSPGKLLIGAAIEAARAAGARHFDFLRGREAHKYDWGAVGRPTMQITFEALQTYLSMPAIAHQPYGQARDSRTEPPP